MFSSSFLPVVLFGTIALGQFAPTTSGTATKTASGKSSVTSASGGISTNGPLALAESACFPKAFATVVTDTPCFSMEVLNQACFFGPSVLETATATPTASASPKEQQQCYCDPVNGVGYMYFEFMAGCSNCFRLHGSAGGPGAYSPEFIQSLSKSYCAVQTPKLAFGKFLTSMAGTTAVATKDLATSTVLGSTQTAVSLYFTTIPLGAAANSTNNTSTSFSSSTNSITLGSAAATLSTDEATTTGLGAVASGPTTSPPAPQSTNNKNGANGVQVSGLLGAIVLGAAALL